MEVGEVVNKDIEAEEVWVVWKEEVEGVDMVMLEVLKVELVNVEFVWKDVVEVV